MKVLLVIPTYQYLKGKIAEVGITDMPIGMAYLSASLKKAGHEVWSANLNNNFKYQNTTVMVRESLAYWLWQSNADVIMTGGICTDYACLRQIINVCRETVPATAVVLGGGIMTHDSSFIFEDLKPDFGIIGEAEETAPALLTQIGGPEAFQLVPNLIYRHNEYTRRTPETDPCSNIDSLPFPDYSIFGDFMRHSGAARDLYRFPEANPRLLVLVAGRSCPFHCTFCVHEHRVPYRPRSIPNIMAELTAMHEAHRFNLLVILDELFAAKADRVREFSQAVLDSRLKFHWCFQTHASANLDSETLKLARSAGCYLFSYGIESASPTVLESMDKRTRPGQIQAGIELAHKAGIGFGGNFIFGDPAETPATIAETFGFFRDHCEGLHIWLSPIRPYPGSRIFEHAVNANIIRNKHRYYQTIDQRIYNLTSLPSWSWKLWLYVLGFLGGKGLWLHTSILACPYCGQLVPKPVPSQQFRDSTLFLTLLLFFIRFMSRIHPWWRELESLIQPPFNTTRTACPSCFRSVRSIH